MCRCPRPPRRGGKRPQQQTARGADKPPHGGGDRLDHGDEQPPDRVVIGEEAAKRADKHKAAHAPVPGDEEEHARQHCADDEEQKIAERDEEQPEEIAPAAGRAHVDEQKHARKAHDVVQHTVQDPERERGGKCGRLRLHRNLHYFARRANSPFFSPGRAA